MGFFDKIKASVGIGGAKIQLVAPKIVCAQSALPLQITIQGGNLDQTLNGIDLVLQSGHEVEVERTQSSLDAEGDRTERNVKEKKQIVNKLVTDRVDTSAAKTIAKGSTKVWPATLQAPSFTKLYDGQLDSHTFVGRDIGEIFHLAQSIDLALPAIDTVDPRKFGLHASADIPGAVDPSAHQSIRFLPEARGATSQPVGRVGSSHVITLLQQAGSTRAFPMFIDEQWFIWFSDDEARVTGFADLKAIVSVRAEGVVRSYTNRNIPDASALAKLPSETADRIPGKLDEARQWAERLVQEADVDTLLPRPIGNALFALKDLQLFS